MKSFLSWAQTVLDGLDGFWVWMTPGVNALAAAAPIATPIVALFAAIYAVRTFQLKVRVDHGDQWLKRFQEGLVKSLSEDEVEQEFGSKLLATLNEPERPWLFFDPKTKLFTRRKSGRSRSNDLESGEARETEAGEAHEAETAPEPVAVSPIYNKYPGLCFDSKAAKGRVEENIDSPMTEHTVDSDNNFTRERPSFAVRGRKYWAYRKARSVKWNVSPAEVEMHRAISQILQNKVLGIGHPVTKNADGERCPVVDEEDTIKS